MYRVCTLEVDGIECRKREYMKNKEKNSKRYIYIYVYMKKEKHESRILKWSFHIIVITPVEMSNKIRNTRIVKEKMERGRVWVKMR